MGTKEALGDAGTGAALGSIAGPYGTLIGGIGGGLYGMFFDNAQEDADNAAKAAQAAKIEALKQAGMKIDAYRPELMQMEQAGKQEQLGQFGDARSLLAAMQGQGQGPTIGQRPNTAGLGAYNPPDSSMVSPSMLRPKVDQTPGQMPITPLALRRR